jgi:phospholipase/lecithinase/hemolysin
MQSHLSAVEFDRATTQDFDNQIWQGAKSLRSSKGINFAFVNWAELYDAIFAGYAAFGYKNTSSCLVSETSTVGGCSDPDDCEC